MVRGTAAPDAAQPIVMSCHAFRSVRRHAKRHQQERHISSLREQLSAWWTWWTFGNWKMQDNIDIEVSERLQAIEPAIRAQVLAKQRGDPHHSSRRLVGPDVHTRSNGAKHYYPDKSFALVSAHEIKKHQHHSPVAPQPQEPPRVAHDLQEKKAEPVRSKMEHPINFQPDVRSVMFNTSPIVRCIESVGAGKQVPARRRSSSPRAPPEAAARVTSAPSSQVPIDAEDEDDKEEVDVEAELRSLMTEDASIAELLLGSPASSSQVSSLAGSASSSSARLSATPSQTFGGDIVGGWVKILEHNGAWVPHCIEAFQDNVGHTLMRDGLFDDSDDEYIVLDISALYAQGKVRFIQCVDLFGREFPDDWEQQSPRPRSQP